MAKIPVDPGDIDLEAIKAQMPSCGSTRELIAAVEALRERVAELEDGWDIWCKTAEQQAEMRKAAEARVVKVVGALRSLYVETGKLDKGTPAFRDAWLQARTVLAAAPAEEEANAALRSYYISEMMADAPPTGGRAASLKEIGAFLAKLDGLGKERP